MTRCVAALKTTVLLCLLLAWHRPARACTVLPPGFAEISRTVPVNGSVVLTFRCGAEESCTVEDLPTYTVHDLTLGGAEVAGRLVRKERVQKPFSVDRWALWRPDMPFVAGHQYELREVGSRNQLPRAFSVIETDPFDPRTIAPRFSLFGIEDHSGPKLCCPVVPGTGICGSKESCFRTERTQRVEMSVAPLRLTEPIEQWVYRSTYRVGDQTTVIAEVPLPSPFFYADKADEYCYSLDAIHVVTGEVVRIGEECKRFASFPFSTYPASQKDTDAYLRGCASPPAGFEARWQELKDGGAGAPDAGSQVEVTAGASPSTGAPEADNEESGCRLGERSSGPWLSTSIVLLMWCSRRRRQRAA